MASRFIEYDADDSIPVYDSSSSSWQRQNDRPKVVIVGDSGVGKTTLIVGMSECQNVDNDYEFARRVLGTANQSTIGVDYVDLEFETRRKDGTERFFPMWVWDTAGQERYATFTSQYVRGAALIIMVYDVSNPCCDSLYQRWYLGVVAREIERCTSRNSRTPALLLVGAKRDLATNINVQSADALAKSIGCQHVIVSARSLNTFTRALVPTCIDLLRLRNMMPDYHESGDIIDVYSKTDDRFCCSR